jgi:hypothetical protein
LTGDASTGRAGPRGRSRKRGYVVAFFILLALFAAPKIVHRAIPWTRLNCEDISVDIAGGRQRTERFRWFMRIGDEVADTSLSIEFRRLAGELPPPDWRIDARLDPVTRHSPHYPYHGALSTSNVLASYLEESHISDTERLTVIKRYFELLQTHGGDDEAGRYVSDLHRETAPPVDLRE